LARLKKYGVPVLVISAEKNKVVARRCGKLGVEFFEGRVDKLKILDAWLRRRKIQRSQVVYVGNDGNDVSCLEVVGCGVAVADALPVAKRVSKLVLSANGGRGAVREICDLVIEKLKGEKG
jgi:YrbI family 3-deoxy-D-manno-octulosonate 8-phosphate phosphatase